jgi:amino acid adenylation domain-containing protein
MPRFLDDIIREGALTRPDAEACRFGDQALTHAGLDAAADRLADALRARGVARGDRVGILLDKSLDGMVALYGIMRAGAAWVPLDPGAPPARLGGIAAECGIGVIVSSPARRRTLEALAPAATALRVVVDAAGADLGQFADPAAPASEAKRDPGDLAYVIFTSGSTGTPKGIMHSHETGLAYARMARDLYGLTPDDRLGNHSPLHFDMSTFDIFSGPLAGACTVIIPEMHAKLPASLAALIEAERITVWYSVPFAITQLVERGGIDRRDLSALRWIIFGGEPMPPRHLAECARLVPSARFSNSYGPAEVNQITVHMLDPGEIDGQSPVPLGVACEHAELMLLDGDAPADEGELLAATPAMMLGYWNRPERDAAGIVQRPGPDGVRRRWYRTGDLVRRDGDGRLHFIGRSDRQVKVRGHRVELDEVELALGTHPSVSEAAAVVRGDPAGIAAFVTLREGAAPDPDALRAHAMQRLPAYAVPQHVTVLGAFPRTTSGKIDRKNLTEDVR